MIIQELKNSVLQVATEGKLVVQNNEYSAKEELESILEDLKDNKKYKYSLINDAPFEIPNNWVWVKLEDLCLKITDGTHKTPKYTSFGVPFISVKDVSSGEIDFSDTKFISEKEHKELYSRCNPEYGDILITKVGTTGVPAIINTNKEFSLFVSVALLKINTNKIYNRFLVYFLKSPVVQKQVKANTRGIGNKNWVLDSIKTTILPLPPLEEQKRIVESLDLIFSKLDEIEPVEKELSELKKGFSKDIKNSILNSAYSGELVKGLTNYDSWNTSIMSEIAEINTGNSISESVKKEKYMNNNDGYRYIATKDLGFDHVFNYDNGVKIPYNECGFKYAYPNDILMCIEGGSAGKKIGILSQQVCFGNKLCRFGVSTDIIDSKYLYYYLQSPLFLSNFFDNLSGIIGGVSINKIKRLSIRYPDLIEQKKIVEKIEHILAICSDINDLTNDM